MCSTKQWGGWLRKVKLQTKWVDGRVKTSNLLLYMLFPSCFLHKWINWIKTKSKICSSSGFYLQQYKVNYLPVISWHGFLTKVCIGITKQIAQTWNWQSFYDERFIDFWMEALFASLTRKRRWVAPWKHTQHSSLWLHRVMGFSLWLTCSTALTVEKEFDSYSHVKRACSSCF